MADAFADADPVIGVAVVLQVVIVPESANELVVARRGQLARTVHIRDDNVGPELFEGPAIEPVIGEVDRGAEAKRAHRHAGRFQAWNPVGIFARECPLFQCRLFGQ